MEAVSEQEGEQVKTSGRAMCSGRRFESEPGPQQPLARNVRWERVLWPSGGRVQTAVSPSLHHSAAVSGRMANDLERQDIVAHQVVGLLRCQIAPREPLFEIELGVSPGQMPQPHLEGGGCASPATEKNAQNVLI